MIAPSQLSEDVELSVIRMISDGLPMNTKCYTPASSTEGVKYTGYGSSGQQRDIGFFKAINISVNVEITVLTYGVRDDGVAYTSSDIESSTRKRIEIYLGEVNSSRTSPVVRPIALGAKLMNTRPITIVECTIRVDHGSGFSSTNYTKPELSQLVLGDITFA